MCIVHCEQVWVMVSHMTPPNLMQTSAYVTWCKSCKLCTSVIKYVIWNFCSDFLFFFRMYHFGSYKAIWNADHSRQYQPSCTNRVKHTLCDMKTLDLLLSRSREKTKTKKQEMPPSPTSENMPELNIYTDHLLIKDYLEKSFLGLAVDQGIQTNRGQSNRPLLRRGA